MGRAERGWERRREEEFDAGKDGDDDDGDVVNDEKSWCEGCGVGGNGAEGVRFLPFPLLPPTAAKRFSRSLVRSFV